MKKFILFLGCFLAVSFLLVCVLIFVPFSSPYGKGPTARYRVEGGAVDVFSLRDGQARSLLSFVKPGDTFTARPISAAALKIPVWLEWMEPVMVAVVGRANLFMYNESIKAPHRDFSVGYTDESIQRGFAKEIEKIRILSDVRINFHEDGFSFSAQSKFMPLAVRGYVSTLGTSDHLFLRLQWVKIGQLSLPGHVLRALENVFSKAYVESSHPSIKLLRITFSDKMMVMFYQKEAGGSAGISREGSSLAAPVIV